MPPPQVILGTKSGAAKSRDVAFRLLVCVAQRVDAAGGGAGDAAGASGTGLGDVFSMLLAGLAGTTAHMVGAAGPRWRLAELFDHGCLTTAA